MITGVTQNEVSLNETVKIYVNHRPVIPLSTADIQSAFDEIKKKYVIFSHFFYFLIFDALLD
jgi:hypothetical protein